MLRTGSTMALWRFGRLIGGVVVGAMLLAACSTTNRAPVVDLSGSTQSQAGVETSTVTSSSYVVRSGDTLYSIARQHGVTWQEIAAWNDINDPSQLRVGRTLRIGQGSSAVAGSAGGSMAQVQPIAIPSTESRSVESTAQSSSATRAPTRANDSGIDWTWPAQGKILSTYNQSLNKGLDIEGGLGDPVVAAADGTVVYAGSGLRGYGNLLILRHNTSFLSAYAHNSKLLVKEGDTVRRGQQIAELGQSDAPSPRLHFEIRRGGTPEDPRIFLPPRP